MKATGAIFDELPVHGDKGDRLTNEICSKNSESNYTIDGRDISFPVVVSDASMLMNGFLVNARAAQAMLEGTGFRVVEIFPGKAILQLLAVDYKENDLGDYNEGAIILPGTDARRKEALSFFRRDGAYGERHHRQFRLQDASGPGIHHPRRALHLGFPKMGEPHRYRVRPQCRTRHFYRRG